MLSWYHLLDYFTFMRINLLGIQTKWWIIGAFPVLCFCPHTLIWELIMVRGRVLRDAIPFGAVATSGATVPLPLASRFREGGGGHWSPRIHSNVWFWALFLEEESPNLMLQSTCKVYTTVAPLIHGDRFQTPSRITLYCSFDFCTVFRILSGDF